MNPNHELRISIGPSHFRHRICERMNEIGNSVYYYKILDNPGIVLFKIKYEDKNPERRIMEIIKEASSGFPYLPFLLNGYTKQTPDKKYGLSLRAETSPEIAGLCKELERLLTSEKLEFQNMLNADNRLYVPVLEYPGFINAEIIYRHASKRKNDIVTRLLSLVAKSPRYKIRDFVLPAESIHIELSDENGHLKTYDLIQKRWSGKTTGSRSGESFEVFRRLRNYESTGTKFSEKDEVYLLSDLHLDHSDIIWGASRPYPIGDSKRMDKVLVRNWNNTIKPSDTVYYLGDLTYNLDRENCTRYLSELNGNIKFIKGNHDGSMEDLPEQVTINYSGRDYLLVHDPKFRPDEYSGWTIHGHVHNSRISDYPFIDFTNKTINVCCELTGYHPVKLEEISGLIDLYEKGEVGVERFLLYEDFLAIYKGISP
ncbi:metallophosphoesterase family protein [Methanolacinia petrolearia]|uniref:metallophosphoesterase family protein n=1 Tax=Methanolacinia petrolearia TaxID=54120 RepID=UPI003BAB2577